MEQKKTLNMALTTPHDQSTYQAEADSNLYLFLKHEDILWNVPHYHDSVEIICVTQGETIAHIDGKEYRIMPNQICFADSRQIHFYDNYCKDARIIVLVLSRDYTHHFRRQFSKKTFPTLMGDIEKNKPIVEALTTFVNEPNHSYLSVCAQANFLLDLMSKTYPLIDQESQPTETQAYQFIDYIKEHFTEDISLKTIAQHFGYNHVHFSKLFNKTIGMSFLSVLNNYRMQKVLEQLNDADNKKKVAILCYECGFNSTTTFYRHYAEYQKKLKDIPIP